MKNVIRWIVNIPNIPFLIIYVICIIYNIHKHTNIIEFEMMDQNQILTKELKQYAKENYPQWLKYTIAGLAYGFIAINILI